MRRALTLIEALIAVSLGAVIVVAAAAALRAAQQTTTQAYRLSRGNALLRAGVHAALTELDSWQAFIDSPSASSPGQPFAPHSLPSGPTGLSAAEFSDFRPSEPRMWFRGDASHDDPRKNGDFARLAYRGHPEKDRSWHDTWIRYMTNRFGYYALIDYAPADFVYWSQPDATSMPDAEFRLVDGSTYSTTGRFFSFAFGGYSQARTLLEANCLAAVHATADPALIASGDSRIMFGQGGQVGPKAPWTSTVLYRTGAQAWDAMPLRPTGWPELRVTTRRVFAHTHRLHAAVIELDDPITAQRQRLYFTTSCTTLRGARRANGLDAGLDAPEALP